MRSCPKCSRQIPDDAVFCPYCGTILAKPPQQQLGGPSEQQITPNVPMGSRAPLLPFALTAVASVTMIATALFVSFSAAAPGQYGSLFTNIFRMVGLFQLLVGALAMVSSVLLYVGFPSVRLWGKVVAGLGFASVLAFLVLVVLGILGVVLFVVPGLLALVAGQMALRRERSAHA